MMNNKFVWLIIGVVGTYFFLRNKNSKELKEKIDKAVDTVEKEQKDDFKKTIDIAISKGYDIVQLKQLLA